MTGRADQYQRDLQARIRAYRVAFMHLRKKLVIGTLVSTWALSSSAEEGTAAQNGAAASTATQNAANTNPIATLLASAGLWEQKGKTARALEALNKVLAADPDNAEALAAKARIQTYSGDLDAANRTLGTLREVDPGHSGLAVVEQSLAQKDLDEETLDKARTLAREQQYDAAVSAYRKVFGSTTPTGRLGLEFYQTLGGTKSGYADAIAGVRRLTSEYPNDPEYRLVLGQMLSYRQEHRREGIEVLSDLAGPGSIGRRAQESWRQALVWLQATGTDKTLYKEYLRRYPNDPALKDALAGRFSGGGGQRGRAAPRAAAGPVALSPADTWLKNGFRALNSDQLADAESWFNRVLNQRANDAAALGGLGVVRLRQSRFNEAQQYLERSGRVSPGQASRWAQALDSARYWGLMEQVQAARNAQDLVTAERLLRQAVNSRPQELTGQIGYADVLAQLGQLAAADGRYRAILAANPNNFDARRGLLGVLEQQNRFEEALALADSMTPEQRAQLNNLGNLQARALRFGAEGASNAGDYERARIMLEEALVNDPSGPWIRLELARVYIAQNRLPDAKTLVDGLLVSHPDSPRALYVSALLDAENKDWWTGLQKLEQIPFASRTPDSAKLQTRLWVMYQAERAAVESRFGRYANARQILAALQQSVDIQATPEYLGAVALAWAEAGDEYQALSMMRSAMSSSTHPDAGLRLQYAGILFKLSQDAEFMVQLRELERLPAQSMTAGQLKSLEQLRNGFALRRAYQALEAEDLATAYDYLAPMLAQSPRDPELLLILGRLYSAANDELQAYELFTAALIEDPENLEARRGAIQSAVTLKDFARAAELLDQGLLQDPNNPRLYALAGRLARVQGNEIRALQYFQTALALERQAVVVQGAAHERVRPPQLRLLDPQQLPVLNLPDQTPVPQTPVSSTSVPWPTGTVPQQFQQPVAPAQSLQLQQGVGVQSAPLPVGVPVPVEQLPPLPAATQPLSAPNPFTGLPASQRAPIPAPARMRYQGGAQAVPMRFEGQAAQPKRYYDYDVSAPSQEAKAEQPLQQIYGQALPVNAHAQNGYQARSQTVADTGNHQYGAAYDYPTDTQPVYEYQLPQDAYQQPYQSNTSGTVYLPQVAPPPALAAPAPVQAPVYAPSRAPQANPTYVTAPVPASQFDPNQNPFRPQAPAGYSVPAPAQNWGGGVYQDLNTTPADRAYHDAIYGQVPPHQPFETRSRPQPQTVPAVPQPSFEASRQLGLPVYQPGMTLQTSPGRELSPLEAEINDIKAKRSGNAAAGVSFRSRDGDEGLGELIDIEIPIEASIAVGPSGRLTGKLTPVLLDAGTVAGDRLSQHGTGAVNTGTLGGASARQSAEGVAVGVAFNTGNLTIDVGTTPLGFDQTNVVGGVKWTPRVDQMRYSLNLSRRAVTDSFLSYNGSTDISTGREWGGVTKTGGRLDIIFDDGGYGLYANIGAFGVNGENVRSNTVVEAGLGFFSRLVKEAREEVVVGLNLTSFFYERNLSRFTLGHGGYFSPQYYVSLGVPVEWSGLTDDGYGAFKVGGSVGLQAYREDATDLFANDADLQVQLEALGANNAGIPTTTDRNSEAGANYNLYAQGEYLLNSYLSIGGTVAFNNSKDYNEQMIMGYVRYWFWPQRGPVNYPPKVLQPFYTGVL